MLQERGRRGQVRPVHLLPVRQRGLAVDRRLQQQRQQLVLVGVGELAPVVLLLVLNHLGTRNEKIAAN